MNNSMKEIGPQPEIPSINKINAAVDLTVSDKFKKLIPEKGRKISKLVWQRSLLSASALALILSSGCANINPFREEPSPTSISMPVPEDHSLQNDIVLNSEGLPIGHLLTNGTMTPFNIADVSKMKETAIDSETPQLLGIFPSKVRYPDSNPPDPEHQILSNLPEDALSTEQLASNGVTIIQADNTNLSIRKQAFEEGGPFAELANQHGKEKLTIVLVDAPFLSKSFMKDKKYDGVRDMLTDPPAIDVAKYRADAIKRLQNQLEELRNNPNKELLKEYSESINASIYAYENGIVTDERISEIEMSKYPEAPGLFYAGVSKKGKYLDRTIFAAVGQQDLNATVEEVYFDSNGKLTFYNAPRDGYDDQDDIQTRVSRESCPNPSDFTLNTDASVSNPKSYPYAAQSPGFVLRHEVTHDEDVAQAINLGKKPDYSEYDTDMGAMQGISDAWNNWKDSNFTDNSGYYFVFSLPKEQGGGYILTKVPENKSALIFG